MYVRCLFYHVNGIVLHTSSSSLTDSMAGTKNFDLKFHIFNQLPALVRTQQLHFVSELCQVSPTAGHVPMLDQLIAAAPKCPFEELTMDFVTFVSVSGCQ